MTDKIQDIALDLIVPNGRNPRPKEHFQKSNREMQELIASIKAGKVEQAIAVRPHPTKAGKFEIIYGERRWLASGFANKKTVPSVVRNYGDDEAHQVMLLENINRANPDPIMEAESVASYQQQDKPLTDIAQRLGKPLDWVLRRAQIAKLSPAWRKAIASGDIDWTIEHYIRIARFTHEVQDECLKRHSHQNGWIPNVESLEQEFTRLMRDIHKAPWKVDDADLVPEAGACSACAKRTSCQNALFPELLAEKKSKASIPDLCTDHHCWSRKADAHLERTRITLKEKHPDLVEITSNFENKGKVLGTSTVEPCKKDDKGAVPALWVDGERMGSRTWVKPTGYGNAKQNAAKVAKATDKPLTKKEQGAELEQKREALDKRRTLLAWRGLADVLKTIKPKDEAFGADEDDNEPVVVLDGHEETPPAVEDEEAGESQGKLALPAGTIPDHDNLVVWATLYGVGRSPYWTHENVAKLRTNLLEKVKHRNEAFWSVCYDTMEESILGCIANRRMNAPEPAIIASMIGVDLADLERQAVTAIPEPKAWRSQYPAFFPQKEAA